MNSTRSSDSILFYGILHTSFVKDIATVIVPFWYADYIDNYNIDNYSYSGRQWKVYFITLKLSEAPGLFSLHSHKALCKQTILFYFYNLLFHLRSYWVGCAKKKKDCWKK